jgi:predicted AAA+ superfamily ATPase
MMKKQLYRYLEERLPDACTRRLVLITGARQVGKTTLAHSVYPGLRYLNLDSPEEREALAALPTRLWAGQVGPAVFDEAQKQPGLFDKLKFAYDAGAVDFSVLLGSAQILLLQRTRETLAGRVFVYELWPLTAGELAASGDRPARPLFARMVESPETAITLLDDEPPLRLDDGEAGAENAVRHLAEWGGMPALLDLDVTDRKDWLRSYHETYLLRDLTDLARLRDLEPFSRFQRLAALRSGQLLGYADLARDAGTSAGTARNYLEYLRLSYQAFLLPPLATNPTTAAVRSPKLFWSDLGVLRQLTGNWGPVSGALFETLVVSEVAKLVRTLSLDCSLSFYRTRSGLEVDLVVETPAGMLAFECKARSTAVPSDFRGLRRVASVIGDRFLFGAVVTLGGRLDRPPGLKGEGPFWTVPLHRLVGAAGAP